MNNRPIQLPASDYRASNNDVNADACEPSSCSKVIARIEPSTL